MVLSARENVFLEVVDLWMRLEKRVLIQGKAAERHNQVKMRSVLSL